MAEIEYYNQSMNIRTKTRATAIVIRDGHALLIHRKNEKEYFVFPGGGVEEGETPECAVIREVMEETSIEVRLVRLLESKLYDDGSENISYLCEYISGEPRLADDSPERREMKVGVQYYDPVWIKISDIRDMVNVYPESTRLELLKMSTSSSNLNRNKL